jgi:hypothetical protein
MSVSVSQSVYSQVDKSHSDKLAAHDLLTRGEDSRTMEPDTAERTNCGIGSCQPL